MKYHVRWVVFNYIMILYYEGKRELLIYLKCQGNTLIVLDYLNSINNSSNISDIFIMIKTYNLFRLKIKL